MRGRRFNYLLALLSLGLMVSACGPSEATPDANAQVATAVAATLTAQAPPSPTATATSPPSGELEETPLASSPTPSPIPPTPSETPPQPTATSAPLLCKVVSETLNVRSGPGLVYAPPLANLPRDTELVPVAFNPAGFPGQWLQVQLAATNQTGWVSADPQFVSCNITDFGALPFGAAPPTPTPTTVPTPIPDPPTPTPPTFFVLVPGGGGNDRVEGQVLFPGYRPGDLDPNDLVFRDRLAFRVETFDIGSGSTRDGSGIDYVEMTISANGEEVHSQREENAPYCLFGGDDPECRPWWVFTEHGYTWPGGKPVENIVYDVRIVIQPEQDDSANWNFSFRIEGAPDPTLSALQAEIIQIGPGSQDVFVTGALVFQVAAYDPQAGTSDGDGIDEVEMRILRNGQAIYENTEGNAAYCLFEGGEPDCNIWVFADHNNEWPSGEPIEPGLYTLQAVIDADNGQELTVEVEVEIQP